MANGWLNLGNVAQPTPNPLDVLRMKDEITNSRIASLRLAAAEKEQSDTNAYNTWMKGIMSDTKNPFAGTFTPAQLSQGAKMNVNPAVLAQIEQGQVAAAKANYDSTMKYAIELYKGGQTDAANELIAGLRQRNPLGAQKIPDNFKLIGTYSENTKGITFETSFRSPADIQQMIATHPKTSPDIINEIQNAKPGTKYKLISVGGAITGMTAVKAPAQTATSWMDTLNNPDATAEQKTKAKKNLQQYYAMQSSLAAARGAAYNNAREYQVMDKNTGQVRYASGLEMKANPKQFIGPSDPGVAAFKKNQEYSVATQRFTDTMKQYSSLIKDLMTQYGLNQHSKLWNWGVQDIIQKGGLGSGAVTALQNLVAGFQQEQTKVESGSLGMAAATVDASKRFNVNPNMPFKDMVLYTQWGVKAGDARQAGIDESQRDLGIAMGLKVNPYVSSVKSTGGSTANIEDLRKKYGY